MIFVISLLYFFKYFVILKLFYDVGPYHIETSPWSGFYMIWTFVMKELRRGKKTYDGFRS